MKRAKALAAQPVAAPRNEVATVEPAHAALRAALDEAIQQLEGWVAWKCPKKYLREHQANIARLRAVLAPEGSVESMVYPNVADIEMLIWYDNFDGHRPDDEVGVLVHGVVEGIVEGWWDSERSCWRKLNGSAFDDEIIAWAEPRGVLL